MTNRAVAQRLVTPTVIPAGLDTPCISERDTSLASLDDIVNRAEREGVMLYTVSVDDAGGAPKDGDLRRVARESGGERYRLSDYKDLGAGVRPRHRRGRVARTRPDLQLDSVAGARERAGVSHERLSGQRAPTDPSCAPPTVSTARRCRL